MFLVGGYWLFTTQASVRLFVGQYAPPLQDAFYMLLNQYKGQDFVSRLPLCACPFAGSQELPTFSRRPVFPLPPPPSYDAGFGLGIGVGV